MTLEDIKNLNNFLKEIETNMQYDLFFSNTTKSLYNLFLNILNSPNTRLYLGPLPKITKEEIYSIVSNFLNSISPLYQERFNKDKYLIKESNESYFDNEKRTININFHNNITDSFVLLHEYIHNIANPWKNYQDMNDTYFLYSELTSILGEMLLKDYIIDKYSITDINIQETYRLENIINEMRTYMILIPLYIIYKDKKSITIEDINILKNRGLKYYYNNEYLNYINNIIKDTPTIEYLHSLNYLLAVNIYKEGITLEEYHNMIEDISILSPLEFTNKYHISIDNQITVKKH